LLVQMNPKDPNLCPRAAVVHGEWGERLQELGELEEAGDAFLKAAEYSQQAADNLFKMDPNSRLDDVRANELLSRAIDIYETANLPEKAASARQKRRGTGTL